MQSYHTHFHVAESSEDIIHVLSQIISEILTFHLNFTQEPNIVLYIIAFIKLFMKEKKKSNNWQ